jgi:hypothetical protein
MTPAQARAWLRERGIATLRELCDAVAGEPVRGSWWAHRAGKQIFAAANALDDDPDIITTKWVEGRVTFVHRRKWPELFAEVDERRKSGLAELSAPARKLLALVEKRGELRMDDPAAHPLRNHRVELEKALLVHAKQIHSELGKHVAVLESWDHLRPVSSLRRTSRKTRG